MDQKSRVDRIEADAKKRIKTFWDKFSNYELEAIRDGDPIVSERFEMMGGREIVELEIALMTPQERAEFEQVVKELQAREGPPCQPI
jgi:hypothetical protein